MKQVWKKRAVVVSVLLLVCAAVYMNWRYTDNIQKNAGKTLGQTTLVSSQDGEKGQEPTAAPAEDDYFATARLSRKQARDNAITAPIFGALISLGGLGAGSQNGHRQHQSGSKGFHGRPPVS